jgi:predicted enzyme related to lactoylglutathione lyase
MATMTLQARSVMASITVSDVKRSIAFYAGALGFTVRDEMKDDKGVLAGAMLSAGEASAGLAISQDDFAKGRDRVMGIGVRLWIETDQDIEAIAKNVKAAGFKLDSEPGPLPWGPIAFMVSDPDGYKLAITKPS